MADPPDPPDPAAAESPDGKRRPLWSRRQNVILLILAGILVTLTAIRLGCDAGRGNVITINSGNREAIDPRLDVNTASWPSLARLPGLGPKSAKVLVAEREANGPFRSGADLIRRVRGIGPATFAKFRNCVRFPPATRPSTTAAHN